MNILWFYILFINHVILKKATKVSENWYLWIEFDLVYKCDPLMTSSDLCSFMFKIT